MAAARPRGEIEANRTGAHIRCLKAKLDTADLVISASTPLDLRGSERAITLTDSDWPQVRGISSRKFADNWAWAYSDPHTPGVEI